jgi:hypothetical protein
MQEQPLEGLVPDMIPSPRKAVWIPFCSDRESFLKGVDKFSLVFIISPSVGEDFKVEHGNIPSEKLGRHSQWQTITQEH